MSESGTTTTKPVPAPRRGRKPKEPRALDKLQNVRLLFQDTFRQFYEWMDKLVCCPTGKGETLPKWADLLKNELFVVLEEGESFSTRAVCSPCGTKVRNCLEKLHGDAFANQRRTEHAN